MELGTRVNGKTIFNTVTEKKYGLITHNMKDSTTKVKNMDVVSTSGKMAQDTTVNGSRIELKVKENISGKTVEHTQDNGKIIICTVKELTHGLTVEDTKVSTRWTRSTAMVNMFGRMETSTRATGRLTSVPAMAPASTPMVFISIPKISFVVLTICTRRRTP